MANTKTPLIQNYKQSPKYFEEIQLKCHNGEKESTPPPQSSVSNLDNLGKRLRRRKDLIRRRRWIVDFEFLFATAGVILMVVNIELYFSVTYMIGFILEIAITVTTMFLITFVGFYHWTGIHIRMLDDGLTNWRLVCTRWTLTKIIGEVIICSIQPIPDFMDQVSFMNFFTKSIFYLLSYLRNSICSISTS